MLVALLFLVFLTHCTNGLDNDNEISNITWKSQISMAKSNTQTLLKGFLPKLYKTVLEANITSKCQRGLMAYSMALMQWKSWAIKMVDASAKIPSGILEGTLMDFGSYEECLNIRVEESSRNSPPGKELFRGQYCTLTFKHILLSSTDKGEPPEFFKHILNKAESFRSTLSFVFGYCVPSACSKTDIERLSTTITKPLGIKLSVEECIVDGSFAWPSSAIIAVCILCIIASLCIVGTTLDYLHRFEWNVLKTKNDEKKNLFQKVLEAFSVLSNSEKFLKSSSENDIGCFHGMRILSASWIIFGHNYFLPEKFKYIASRRNLNFLEKFGVFSEGLLENFTLSVTTFFVLSGFLLMKITWKQLEKNDGKLNFFKFLLHKYWRLTPPIAFTLIILYAVQVMDSGPLWNPVMNVYVNKCDGYWWSSIFHFSNWLPHDKLCLEHAWFVSALMQLHIVGFILLLVTYRWKSCGILAGVLLSAACFAVIYYFVSLFDIPSTLSFLIKDQDKIENYMEHVYIKPYFHLASYFVGMTVAYFSEKYSGRKITKKYQILGWILAVTFAVFSIYGAYLTPESKAFAVFYHIIHRTSWALSIGLLIYICISGYGGIINKFLSCRVMQLLGQLSYLMYLTHYIVFVYMYASAKERLYSGKTQHVFSFISVFVVAMIISFIGYVTVEVPFSRLERLLFRRKTEK